MAHKIMEENLARLLQEVDYKSCGSEPQLYQLADNSHNDSNSHGRFHKFRQISALQPHVQINESINDDKQDEFVNPFNKRLFKERRLRRSSMCLNSEWQHHQKSTTQKKQITTNKSMFNLRENSDKNVQKQRNTYQENPKIKIQQKLIISPDNYTYLQNKTTSKNDKKLELNDLFENTYKMLHLIHQHTNRQINQKTNQTQQYAVFNKTKENIMYLNQYLAYQYENIYLQIKNQQNKNQLHAHTQYTSIGNHDSCYEQAYNSYQRNYTNPILQITNCQPNNESYYEQSNYGNQNDPYPINYQHKALNNQQNISIKKKSGIAQKKSTRSKGTSSKKQKIANYLNAPKSIYEAVLEERKMRKNAKRINS